jgi:hypothetical protein
MTARGRSTRASTPKPAGGDPDAEELRYRFGAVEVDLEVPKGVWKPILDAHKLVKPGGTLTFVQSSMADVPRSLALMEECGMSVRIVAETDGPFRDDDFADKAFMREIATVPGAYDVRSGTHFERLVVLQARLPRAGA